MILFDDEDTPYRKLCRMRWAALIKRVLEVDPLSCPKCGGEMKIIAFIERRDQRDVVEEILRHCGLTLRFAPLLPLGSPSHCRSAVGPPRLARPAAPHRTRAA